MLLSVDEAAEALGTGFNRRRVYRLIATGILPVVRLGRQVRIDAEQLRDFVRSGGRALPAGSPVEPDEGTR